MTWKLEQDNIRNATDVIIEYQNGIVLIDRKYPPFGIALPGGFQEEHMSLEENCVKEAKEETGLDIIVNSPDRPLCVMSKPDRDPRGQIVTAAYVASGSGILKPHKDEDAKKAYRLGVYALIDYVKRKKDKFAFPDHVKILEYYLEDKGYL